LISSIVTLIQVHVTKAKGWKPMVQQTLPGMPRPIIESPNYRPLPEYRVEPLESHHDCFKITDQDGHTLAVFSPMGDDENVREINVMLVQAMVETFNAVQHEIIEDR
jgi:hypothetical protein